LSPAREPRRAAATAGAETEADLPFAGVHRLLRPVLPRADLIPDRQRAALQAAVGLTDGTASDLFLVGWPRSHCLPISPPRSLC